MNKHKREVVVVHSTTKLDRTVEWPYEETIHILTAVHTGMTWTHKPESLVAAHTVMDFDKCVKQTQRYVDRGVALDLAWEGSVRSEWVDTPEKRFNDWKTFSRAYRRQRRQIVAPPGDKDMTYHFSAKVVNYDGTKRIFAFHGTSDGNAHKLISHYAACNYGYVILVNHHGVGFMQTSYRPDGTYCRGFVSSGLENPVFVEWDTNNPFRQFDAIRKMAATVPDDY